MNMYSVVITTHKRPELLRRAIQSVKDQTYGNTQIILVSDIGCPDTYTIASTMLNGSDIFVQRASSPGPAQSRNVGIRNATGDYVIFLDDDDALSANYLANAEAHAKAGEVLYTDFHVVFERFENGAALPLEVERRTLAEKQIDELYVKNFIPAPCLVYPLEAISNLSFDNDLVLNEDWDFILNVLSTTPLHHVPIDGPIIYTRVVADNRGRKNDHLLVDTYRTIYKNRPAPSPELKLARQSFFASIGLSAALADL
jgi:glycosyltransferase involved in cell wall biosynthesis